MSNDPNRTAKINAAFNQATREQAKSKAKTQSKFTADTARALAAKVYAERQAQATQAER